jgi:hypothetical protein
VLAAAASIADLEAKLPRRVLPKVLFQLGEQLGLSQLELLGPDGAIDFQLEHDAANAERSAMGRDLRAHDLFPVDTNPMGKCNTIQAKIAEYLAHQVTHRFETSLSPPPRSTSAASAEHQSRSPLR